MKFRMFTSESTGRKIAVNVDKVSHVCETREGGCDIVFGAVNHFVSVAESFDVVISRLNTVAE